MPRVESAQPIDVAAIGAELADAVDRVLADWVARSIMARSAAAGVVIDASAIADAGAEARAAVMAPLRALLAADIEAQHTTPLAIVRRAVAAPTALLAQRRVAPVPRDPDDRARFPDDFYALTPAAWSDLDDVGHDELRDVGLRWSVAKAYETKRRHR